MEQEIYIKSHKDNPVVILSITCGAKSTIYTCKMNTQYSASQTNFQVVNLDVFFISNQKTTEKFHENAGFEYAPSGYFSFLPNTKKAVLTYR